MNSQSSKNIDLNEGQISSPSNTAGFNRTGNNHIPDILDNIDINVYNENMKSNDKFSEKKHLFKIIKNDFLNYY